MTRDEIIEIMGWLPAAESAMSDIVDRIERIVVRAEKREREACAKLCDEQEAWYWRAYKHGEAGTDLHGSSYAEGASNGALFCANAIRARGEK